MANSCQVFEPWKTPEGPKLMQITDPAQLEWDEIRKIDHYALRLAALGRNKSNP
jgi:hypothetical protein